MFNLIYIYIFNFHATKNCLVKDQCSEEETNNFEKFINHQTVPDTHQAESDPNETWTMFGGGRGSQR